MDDLLQVARAARANAYCPFSHYPVGAAVRDAEGRIWAGCNVENVSFGATICAERVAIGSMVAAVGKQDVVAVAVVTKDGGSPCGMCLQVLFEFAKDKANTKVVLEDQNGTQSEYSLLQLMPHGFQSDL